VRLTATTRLSSFWGLGANAVDIVASPFDQLCGC